MYILSQCICCTASYIFFCVQTKFLRKMIILFSSLHKRIFPNRWWYLKGVHREGGSEKAQGWIMSKWMAHYNLWFSLWLQERDSVCKGCHGPTLLQPCGRCELPEFKIGSSICCLLQSPIYTCTSKSLKHLRVYIFKVACISKYWVSEDISLGWMGSWC